MIKNTKTTKKKKTLSPHGVAFTFRPSDVVLLPMSAIALYCWYYTLANIGGFTQVSSLLFSLPMVAFLVAVFSTLYAVMDLRRVVIPRYGRIVAYVFSALTTCAVFFLLIAGISSGSSEQCSGFMGVQESCSEVGLLTLALLYLNPISLIVWEILSVSGIATLFVAMRKK